MKKYSLVFLFLSTWIMDIEAREAPINVVATKTATGSMLVEWKISADPPDGFQIWIDETKVATGIDKTRRNFVLSSVAEGEICGITVLARFGSVGETNARSEPVCSTEATEETYGRTLVLTPPDTYEDGTSLPIEDLKSYYVHYSQNWPPVDEPVPVVIEEGRLVLESLEPGDWYVAAQVETVDGVLSNMSPTLTISLPPKPPPTDSMPPLLELLGDPLMTIKRGDIFSDPGATCIDDIDGEVTEILVTGAVDNSKMGDYELNYLCSDTAGNTSTRMRIVTVISRGKPNSPGLEIVQ